MALDWPPRNSITGTAHRISSVGAQSPFFGKISDRFISDFTEEMGKREVKTLAKETVNWYTEEEDE